MAIRIFVPDIPHNGVRGGKGRKIAASTNPAFRELVGIVHRNKYFMHIPD
jgi:hypothetical protein